jgi:hypothetical protein
VNLWTFESIPISSRFGFPVWRDGEIAAVLPGMVKVGERSYREDEKIWSVLDPKVLVDLEFVPLDAPPTRRFPQVVSRNTVGGQ